MCCVPKLVTAVLQITSKRYNPLFVRLPLSPYDDQGRLGSEMERPTGTPQGGGGGGELGPDRSLCHRVGWPGGLRPVHAESAIRLHVLARPPINPFLLSVVRRAEEPFLASREHPEWHTVFFSPMDKCGVILCATFMYAICAV